MKKEFFNKFLRIAGVVGFSFFLLLLDHISKIWVRHHLSPFNLGDSYPFGGIGVFQDFFGISLSLNLLTNPGAAWGIFGEYPIALFFIRIGLVVILLITLLQKGLPTLQRICLLMILTGALGNLWDVLSYGYVVDMIHFRFNDWSFPLFNLADSLITLGIGSLVTLSFVSKRKTKSNAETSL